MKSDETLLEVTEKFIIVFNRAESLYIKIKNQKLAIIIKIVLI